MKLDLVLSSCEGWETPTLLSFLERANISDWTTYVNTITDIYIHLKSGFINGGGENVKYKLG
jgi:hypothetical protein